MNKFSIVCFLIFSVFSVTNAQQEKGIIGYDNWLTIWTEFAPNKVNYGAPTQILTGNITRDTKLEKKDVYLLVGDVFVTNQAILSIEPGTVILGDYKTNGTLTISQGSKIIADGKSTDPIIFSSNRSVKKPGDWGGLFILGEAPTNSFGNESSINYGLKTSSFENIKYGGDDILSRSGVLRYVRIEYAGKRTKDFGFFSGLVLAGVGSKTIIENVMVSYCQGDSYTILGGEVVMDKMISYRSNRTDYNFNNGTQATITNSLAIRSPFVSSPDAYRSMYISNYIDKNDTDFSRNNTKVSASNMTLITVSNNIQSDIKVGLVKEAIFVKEGTSLALDKSVISGFSPAVILDNEIEINNSNLQKISFERTYFNNCNGNIFVKYNSNNEDLESWYGSRAFDNVYSSGPDSETFINIENSKTPDFRLRINKIVATTESDD